MAREEGYCGETLRVVRTRVVNRAAPVDLYEVSAAGAADRRGFFLESEAALDALERGDFAQAARQAGQLLLARPDDRPLLLTLNRASEALMRGGAGFDPVWTPPGK